MKRVGTRNIFFFLRGLKVVKNLHSQAFTFSTIYTILENMVSIQMRLRYCGTMNANKEKLSI